MLKMENRFVNKGWGSINAAIGKHRLDSVEEIKASIRKIAKTNPEIAEFAKQMEDMRPEHLGLAHDVIDLSKVNNFISDYLDVNLNNIANKSQTLMGLILSKIPAVSRNNPEVLNLVQAVIDKTGQTNGKYFMASLFGRFNLATPMTNAPQIKAVSEIMDTIAKNMEEIHPAGDPYFQKRQKFVDFILALTSGDSKVETIKKMPKITKTIDMHSKTSEPFINVNIRTADPQRVEENLETLPFIIENIENGKIKSQDVTDFLTKNVNLY